GADVLLHPARQLKAINSSAIRRGPHTRGPRRRRAVGVDEGSPRGVLVRRGPHARGRRRRSAIGVDEGSPRGVLVKLGVANNPFKRLIIIPGLDGLLQNADTLFS